MVLLLHNASQAYIRNKAIVVPVEIQGSRLASLCVNRVCFELT